MGNGRAIALGAARQGAAVAVTDIEGDAAQITADMAAETGVASYALTSDAADPDACQAAVTWAVDVLGGLDALVLNVGIGMGSGLQGTSLSDWNTVFEVNLRSNFLTLKAALPLMSEGSATVLISSVAGLRPGSGIPTYDASKAAQIGLMRQAAREAAPQGGRVNVVAPGLIDTPLGRLATAGRPSRGRTASLSGARAPHRRSPTLSSSSFPMKRATSPARSWPSTVDYPRLRNHLPPPPPERPSDVLSCSR